MYPKTLNEWLLIIGPLALMLLVYLLRLFRAYVLKIKADRQAREAQDAIPAPTAAGDKFDPLQSPQASPEILKAPEPERIRPRPLAHPEELSLERSLSIQAAMHAAVHGPEGTSLTLAPDGITTVTTPQIADVSIPSTPLVRPPDLPHLERRRLPCYPMEPFETESRIAAYVDWKKSIAAEIKAKPTDPLGDLKKWAAEKARGEFLTDEKRAEIVSSKAPGQTDEQVINAWVSQVVCEMIKLYNDKLLDYPLTATKPAFVRGKDG